MINSLKDFFTIGIWHIWGGIDHLLFLLMLIIPIINQYQKLKETGKEILKVVTAFSFAHSITLTLSALEIITINTQFIEITIAVSVFLTALNNIFHKINSGIWQIAFLFGLIHGFGFANALNELDLVKEFYIYFLAVFNLGIEIGQLLIVIAVIPILLFLKKRVIFSIKFLDLFSYITVIISILWIYQRIN